MVTLAFLTTFVFLATAGVAPVHAQAGPHVTVDPHSDGAWGSEFLPNVSITLSRGADSCSTTSNGSGQFWFDLRNCEGGGSIDLDAGDLVTVTDGTSTTSHTVTALVVTSFDPVTNVVSGTAAVGSDVFVDIHGQPDVGRTVTATDGTWTTDFDIPGDGGATFDLTPGTEGYAQQNDAQDNATQHNWRVPHPTFVVDPNSDGAWGGDFLPNTAISLTRGADSCATTSDEWGNFGFDLRECEGGGSIDLNAFETVSVSDGTTTKSHTITAVAVTSFDAATNVVSGTAAVGSDVFVDIHGEPDAGRTVTATDGTWTTDFDTPGDGGATSDLVPGTDGYAQQTDTEGDSTQSNFHIPNPRFGVDPHRDGAWGWDFLPNTAISLTRGADSCATTSDEWGNFGFDLRECEGGGSIDLNATETVSVSDGTTTKSHTITELVVTSFDPATNVVSGTAAAGSDVLVDIHGSPDAGRTVTATDGTWTTDFDTPGDGGGTFDLVLGTEGYAQQTDAEGDSTQHNWRVPSPRFKAGVDSDQLSGWEWAPDSKVDVSVDGGAPISFDTDEWGNFDGGAGVDLQVGQYLTATDGVSSKDFFVRNLTVGDVDADNDLVHGTSVPGDVVHVEVHGDFGSWRQVDAHVTTGAWTADFSVPWHEQPAYDIVAGTSGNARYYEADGDETQRTWHVSDPYITASVIHEEVWATDFPNEPDGLTLYYRLDDPATPAIDFEGDMPLLVNAWGTEAGDRSFGRYDVEAGHVFTVRNRPFGVPLDGGVERVLDISHVTVTSVDGDLDLITGTADPAEGPHVCVWSNDNQLCSDQAAFTWNPDNTWEADFAAIGSDVAPGHWNSVSQFEADGDETHFWWNLPPWIVVELAEEDAAGTPLWPDAVRAEQWTGPIVYLEIDGVPVAEWVHDGSEQYLFELPGFDIEPGHLVRIHDSADDKELLVEPLYIDQINYAWAPPPATPNTVEGTAAAHRSVRVEASATVGGWWAERWVEADATGDFVADFGMPGQGWREQWTADLGGAEGLGRHMRLEIYDPDNDRVTTRQCEGQARIEIARSDGRVDAYDFPEGTTVTLVIDDPDPAGEDYTGTAVSVRNPDNPCETIASFDLEDYVVPDEAVVSADDGEGTSATTTVAPFTIDDVDADADTVSGRAAIGAEVLVEADGNWRYVIAEDDPGDGLDVGYWTADFSVPGTEPGEEFVVDLAPGSSGRALVLDEFGNTTELAWRISNASFGVYPASDHIDGSEFSPDTALTILVDDVAVPGGPYSTDEWGNFGVGLDGVLDLVAGQVVSISDGTTTKLHTITELVITGVDPDADVVSGTAAPGSSLDIWVHDSAAYLTVTACDDTVEFPCDGDDPGTWHADFSAQTDLVPGSNGNSSQCDPQNDCTLAEWWVRNPTFTVETPSAVWSSNQDWELGDTITLTIADPGFPGPLTTLVVPNEHDPENHGWFFELDGTFEILPGHVVTATDGEHTKVLTVVDLTIESVSGDDDTVSGWLFDDSGEPMAGTGVEVNVDNENGNWHRTAVVQPDGSWVADFSVPGDGEGDESLPAEIEPNTGVSAQVLDEDWDSTHRGDCFECDGGGDQIEPIEIEHGDVLVSETDGTLWQYRPATDELFEHPLPFGGVWDIQWVWEDTIFIANSGDGRLWALHLPSGELGPIEDDLFGFPIGMSIESTPVGWNPSSAWIADGESGILHLDDTGVVQVVDIGGADGIVVAPDGTVYFTNVTDTLYAVDETQPGNHRVVAQVEGYSLNGLIMTPDGNVLATSMGPAALVTIDPSDGSFTVADYPQLRTPEDSAIGRTGEIYIIDSGYVDDFGDESGLYVRDSDGTLVQLVDNDDYPDFGDTVDLLVVGPWVTVAKEASHTEVFHPGESVTFDVTVHNQLGPFGLVGLDSLHDTVFGDLVALEGCEPQVLEPGASSTCSSELFVAGDVTNTVVAGWTDEWGFTGESAASASVHLVSPAISIEKTTADGFGNEGDGIGILAGQAVTWNYVVTNDGDIDLVDVVVEDDQLGFVCFIEHIAAGESAMCAAEGEAVHGASSNVGTVSAAAVDADGDVMPVEAADGSSYFGLDPGYVTDSSLCDFGEQFDLIFTPDMKNWPGAYKLAASNPGQFYWNTFFVDDGTAATFGLEIPYPFVTQGAMPLHAYSGVFVDGGPCFIPVGEMAGYPAVFGLADYTDTNGDGVIGIGDVYVVEVPELAPFQYLTLHLDNGLKGTNGWTRGNGDAFNDPGVNPDLAGRDILDGTEYWFALLADGVAVDGGSDLIANANEFKNVKGFGGTVLDGATFDPVAGAAVELHDADGLIEIMTTDEHGWYLSGYKHKGKTATYLLVLLDADGAAIESQTVTVGKSIKFGQADFLMPA